jgi:hypothetical protein
MKFTSYYLHTRLRADRAIIKSEWVGQVFYNYESEVVQADKRIRRWGYIAEVNKYLRIVVLEDKETIHNAFFDRSFVGKIAL